MPVSTWAGPVTATTDAAPIGPGPSYSPWAGPVTATTLASGLPQFIRVSGTATAAAAWVKTADGKILLKRPNAVPPAPPALIPELPFAMPSRATMRASGKDVLAYFHTFPIYSGANTTTYDTWLTPASAPDVGGRWRQRPYPTVSTTGLTDAMRDAYALQDITTAANIGIDAFSYNVFYTPTIGETFRWNDHLMPHYRAAATFSANNTPGFSICPNIDVNALDSNRTAPERTPQVWADAMLPLLTHSAAYKRDGRPVVCIYNVVQPNFPPQWYIDFAAALNPQLAAAGLGNVSIIPSYQGTVAADMDPYAPLFASGIFTYLHVWNAPTYSTAVGSVNASLRTWAGNNGATFIGGTGPRWENDRPDNTPTPKEVEGKGLQVLRNQWLNSITAFPSDPMVHIISWSDHLESHNIRPSTGYQWVPYDISAYYIAWFKTGSAPTITRDAIYYAHRIHLGGAAYDTTQQTRGAYNVASGPPLDLVLTYAFLTATADVIVTTNGVDRTHAAVPAGVTQLEDAMFADDTMRFRAVRGGTAVVPQFDSAFPTRSSIVYQDLLYRMGSSTRAPMANVQANLPQDR